MTQATDTDLREIRDLILGMDKKIEVLDKKVEIFQARTEEKFNGIDQRFCALETQVSDLKKSTDTQFADLKRSTDTQFADLKKSTDTQLADIKVQLRSQDNRLWTFVVSVFLAVLGLLTKFAFFPGGQA